jgi:non-specific riboncleoside hydrolase
MSLKERIIIDTDPGVDDFLALSIALSSDQFIVEAITIVFGNLSDLLMMARNAAYALQLTRKKCPIYLGCTTPITRSHTPCPDFHGLNALGNVEYSLDPEYASLIQTDLTAYQFIIQHIQQNPNKISIITLGPLTNIAKAVTLYPDLPRNVVRIGIMGGSFNFPGNMSPNAEANVYNDPEAARIVFNSNWNKCSISPLNVTSTIHMDEEFLNNLKSIGEIGRVIFQSHIIYVDAYKKRIVPCHDPTPVVHFLYPELFTIKKGFVDVEVTGELTMGTTLVDYDGFFRTETRFKYECELLLWADQKVFKEFVIEVLTKRFKIICGEE